MAKAKQKFELDDFGFELDDSLDMPGFDDFEPRQKKDRNPVISTIKAAGRGVVNTAKSPSFIKKLVLSALPKGYGDAANLASETTGALGTLYNNTVTDLNPTINDIKRATKKFLPKIETKLPKGLAGKLGNWASTAEEKAKYASPEQQREVGIGLEIGNIFTQQAQVENARANENTAREYIRDGVEFDRHKDNVSQLDAIRLGVTQIANYKQRIDSGFQRKSLELQYRHYFVAQDALSQQRKTHDLLNTTLTDVVKNTGLPDFVKLTQTESMKQIMRNKFMDSVNDSIFSKRDAFVKNLVDKLGSAVKDRVGQFKDAVATGLDASDMVESVSEMAESTGMSMKDQVVEQGSGTILNSAGEWLGKKLGKGMNKVLPKNTRSKIDKYGNILEYGVGNLSQLATDWAKTPTKVPGSDNDGVKGILASMAGGLIDVVKDTIRSTTGTASGIETDQAGSLTAPDVIRKSTTKAISEVIPGFLSRILREIQIFRTGDESIDLTSYDYTTNKFADKKTVMANMVSAILGKTANDIFVSKENTKKELEKLNKIKEPNEKQKERIKLLEEMLSDEGVGARRQSKDLVSKLDPENKKLTDEQRDILAQVMVEDNLNNRSGSFKRLAEKSSFKGIAAPHAETFANLFKEYSKDDSNFKKQMEFAKSFSDLGRYNRDGRKEIQDYVNLGNTNLLEELGLIDTTKGSINMEKLREYVYKDGDVAEMASTGITTPKPTATVTHIHNKQQNKYTPHKQTTVDYKPQHSEIPTYVSTKSANDTDFNKIGDEIVKELRENSSKTISETINETLLRIENKLNEGIATNSAGNNIPGENTTDDGNRGFIKRTFGTVGVGLGKLVGKGAKIGFGLAKSVGDAFTDTMGFGLKTAGRILGATRDIAFGYRDIYVKGEKLPRMTGWKIRAGHYINKETGKVINSYKEISGNIVDITDPDNNVLNVDEIKDAYIKHNGVVKLITTLGSGGLKLAKFGIKLANNALGTLGSLIPPAVRMAMSVTKSVLGFGVGLLYRPEDVYVVGKKEPALLAMLMKARGYYSKATGKVIKSPADIDGPVLDIDGNIALSIDDIKAGLLNKNGKPLRVGIGKITGLVKDVLSATNRVVNKGIKTATKVVKGVANTASTFLLHGVDGFRTRSKDLGFTGPDRKLSSDDLVIKRLTEIRNLLDSRLAVNKKVRKGSYEDLMSQKKQSIKDKVDDNTTNSTGLGGGLLKSGLGAIVNLFNKKKDEKKEEDGFLQDTAEVAAGTAATGLLSKGKGILSKGAKYLGKGIGSLKNLGTSGLKTIGTNGSVASGAGKLLAPLAAGMSVYDGVSNLSSGKEVDSAGKIIPKGFLNKINPFEWAMNGGMYAGNKLNTGLNALVSLLAGQETSLGGLAFDGVEKLKSLFTDNKKPDITLKDVNDAKLNISKPPIPKPGIVNKPNPIVNIAKGLDTSKVPVSGIVKASFITSTASVPTDLSMLPETNVDALSAVRYKTYGLKKLEADKVRALINLESAVSKNLDYNNTDVVWNGDVKKLCSEVGSLFGIIDSESNQGAEWSKWFVKRFLPVYLKYVSNITSVTKKKDLASALTNLTGQQKYDAAVAFTSIDGIWSVTYLPWLNYAINTEPSSIDGNMESLKKDVDKVILKEKSVTDTGVNNKPPAPTTLGTDKKSIIGSALDNLSKGWDVVKGAASSVKNYASEKAGQVATGIGNAVTGVRNIATGALVGASAGYSNDGVVGGIKGAFKGMGDAVRAAKATEAKYGVPAAVALAQFSLESANGTRIPPGTNNPFGIKAVKGQAGSAAMTDEVLGGKTVRMSQKFAKYDSIDDAFDAYGKLLATSQYYAKARANVNDPGKFADALTGVYATDPLYGAKLRKIMAKQAPLLAKDSSEVTPTTDSDGVKTTTAPVINTTAASQPLTPATKSTSFNTDNSKALEATKPDAVAPVTKTSVDNNKPTQLALDTPNVKKDQPVVNPTQAISKPSSGSPDKTISTSGGIQLISTTVPTKSSVIPTTPVNQPYSANVSVGGGFMPIKPIDIVEQQRYQRDLSNESLKVTNDTLKSSLGIQQSQLGVLQKMFELMSSGKATLVATNNSSNNTQSQENSKTVNKPDGLARLQSGESMKAPISMRRTTM